MYLLWMKKRASITLRCRMPRGMTWPSAADITSFLSILVLHPVKNRTNRLRVVRASSRQNSDSDGWFIVLNFNAATVRNRQSISPVTCLIFQILIFRCTGDIVVSDTLFNKSICFSEQSYFTPNSTPFTMIFSISSTSTSRLNTVL